MTAQIIPVDPDNARTLARHATEIRRLGKQVASDVIEIGRLLVESKKLAGHGNWLSWLEREFQWTDDTALNYMRVHELVKNRNFRDLSHIPLSGLYLLAAPSTPEGAKQEAISRAEAGEQIPLNTVKEIVRRANAAPAAVEPKTKSVVNHPKLLKAGTVVEANLEHARYFRGFEVGPIELLEDCGGNCERRDDGNYDYVIKASAVISGAHLKKVRSAKIPVAEPGQVGADSSGLAQLKQAWSKATVLEQERFQMWLSREGSPRADPIATMRKALLAWFREHRPDTPDIRVKVSHRENGPHAEISWRHCEDQCHLMLTAPVVEKAIRECGRAAGYKDDIDYNYHMRGPRIRILEISDDETESPWPICATES